MAAVILANCGVDGCPHVPLPIRLIIGAVGVAYLVVAAWTWWRRRS